MSTHPKCLKMIVLAEFSVLNHPVTVKTIPNGKKSV